MLVIKSRIHEYLVIRFQGKIITTIQIVEAGRDWCRLGFDADMMFEIQRSEIDQRNHPEDYDRGTR